MHTLFVFHYPLCLRQLMVGMAPICTLNRKLFLCKLQVAAYFLGNQPTKCSICMSDFQFNFPSTKMASLYCRTRVCSSDFFVNRLAYIYCHQGLPLLSCNLGYCCLIYNIIMYACVQCVCMYTFVCVCMRERKRRGERRELDKQ